MPASGDSCTDIGAGKPLITACVCTHNRPAYLRDCLDGLRAQSVGAGAFNILVVDSGSAAGEAGQIAQLVADVANARLLRVDQPGLSRARNAAARAVGAGYIAYLDDDAIPALDWIAMIQTVINASCPTPSMLGGAIWPLWEAPLPIWWPQDLHGVLSIITARGRGEYRRAEVAEKLEPYGANMIVDVGALLACGGFPEAIGRNGESLLSDEEKVLAWRLQDARHAVVYDSRVVVHHQIQADRLTVRWLLSRMYWQGISRVRSERVLAPQGRMRGEVLRRCVVLGVLAPVALVPVSLAWLMGLRWRWAYARGFVRAYFERGGHGKVMGD